MVCILLQLLFLQRIILMLLFIADSCSLVRTVTSCCSCRYIQSTCAVNGEGLYEGLDWLATALTEPRK